VELFKKHWRAVLGGVAILPSIWRGLVWLFDWGTRVDLVITKLREHGGIAAVIEFLINPPPWFIFPAIIIGLLLIWWDTVRRQKPIIGGDQANFRGIVGDQSIIGNPASRVIESRPIPSETIGYRDSDWQFYSQMAGEIVGRLRGRPEWQDKIIDVTPEYLWDLFQRGRTSMDGSMHTERFINKWMVVCGPFGDVTVLRQATLVTFAVRNSTGSVFMYFSEDWRDRLGIIMQDKKIAVVGRIARVSNNNLQLEDCELIQ